MIFFLQTKQLNDSDENKTQKSPPNLDIINSSTTSFIRSIETRHIFAGTRIPLPPKLNRRRVKHSIGRGDIRNDNEKQRNRESVKQILKRSYEPEKTKTIFQSPAWKLTRWKVDRFGGRGGHKGGRKPVRRVRQGDNATWPRFEKTGGVEERRGGEERGCSPSAAALCRLEIGY